MSKKDVKKSKEEKVKSQDKKRAKDSNQKISTTKIKSSNKDLKKIKKKAEIKRERHVIDLKKEIYGRIASKVALLLSGKRKVNFTPNQDLGDFVIAYNIEKINFKGDNKLEGKKYYRHSWYPGGIKEESLATLMQKDPEKLFKKSVYRMLPKNKLRDSMIKRLKVIKGEYGKKK